MIGSISRPALVAVILLSSVCRAHEPVPFRLQSMVTGQMPGPGGTLLFTGEGEATHLGRFSVTVTQVFTPGTPPTFFGTAVLTAANGDELYVTVSGDVTDPPPNPGGEGSYEIMSGTGRFAGASGTGHFSSHGGMTTYRGVVHLLNGH